MASRVSTRRSKFWGLALAVVCVSLLALAARAEPSGASVPGLLQPEQRVVKLRRYCDDCPNYTITLTGDGLLTFEGSDYATYPGKRVFLLDDVTVNAVFDDFVLSDYLEMDNSYTAPGENKMTCSLTLQIGGFTKSVYSEDRYGPTLRQKLETRLDNLPEMRALSGWIH
jgi:hypothetical protein